MSSGVIIKRVSNLSVCLSAYVCMYVSTHLSIYLSIYPYNYPPIYLSIDLIPVFIQKRIFSLPFLKVSLNPLPVLAHYRPRMRRGNVFVTSVSVCVSVRGVTSETDGTETFFLAQW